MTSAMTLLSLCNVCSSKKDRKWYAVRRFLHMRNQAFEQSSRAPWDPIPKRMCAHLTMRQCHDKCHASGLRAEAVVQHTSCMISDVCTMKLADMKLGRPSNELALENSRLHQCHSDSTMPANFKVCLNNEAANVHAVRLLSCNPQAGLQILSVPVQGLDCRN